MDIKRTTVIECLLDFQDYMKSIKSKLQESGSSEVEAFEKGAQGLAKKIVGNFKDYEFVSQPVRCLLIARILIAKNLTTVHRRVHEPRRHGRSAQLP